VHALAAIPVVAGTYWLAKRMGTENERHLSLARVAYTWVAAGLVVWILEEALRAPWIAVGWIVFAVVLSLSTRWIRYQQLAWQANVVGLCAQLRAYFYNYDLEQKLWGPISLRIFTISLVAAGLYFLSRKAAPEEASPVLPPSFILSRPPGCWPCLHGMNTQWLARSALGHVCAAPGNR